MPNLVPMTHAIALFGCLLLIASKGASAQSCETLQTLCTQGPETRYIDTYPVYRDCWQFKTVERCEFLHIVPYFFVGGVEDVRAVFVYGNAFSCACEDIPPDMRAAVDDEAALAGARSKVRGNGAEKSGADNQIVIAAIFSVRFVHGNLFHLSVRPLQRPASTWSARWRKFVNKAACTYAEASIKREISGYEAASACILLK